MPILPSSKKAERSSARKAARNAVVRKSYKEILKRARKNPTAANLTKAFISIDKAAQANVIHKNKASRLKSRLAKLATKKAPAEVKPVKKVTKKKAKRTTKETIKKD